MHQNLFAAQTLILIIIIMYRNNAIFVCCDFIIIILRILFILRCHGTVRCRHSALLLVSTDTVRRRISNRPRTTHRPYVGDSRWVRSDPSPRARTKKTATRSRRRRSASRWLFQRGGACVANPIKHVLKSTRNLTPRRDRSDSSTYCLW